MWKPYKSDPFGNALFLKRMLIFTLGVWSQKRFKKHFKVNFNGLEKLNALPEKGVLFIANHQTYFADVILMFHCFFLVKNKKTKWEGLRHLLKPKLNVYFVAALETMKDGLLPKLFAYAGSISIKRTWREAGQDVNRKVDLKDISNIGVALEDGWVITFPQGTTTPYVKGRRGSAHIIRKYNPIVIPVVVSGFREGLDKKGLKIVNPGAELSITFKDQLHLDANEKADDVLNKMMDAIEQSDKFNPALNDTKA